MGQPTKIFLQTTCDGGGDDDDEKESVQRAHVSWINIVHNKEKDGRWGR